MISLNLSSVVETAGRSVVRVEGRRRPVTGVVLTPRQVVTVAHGVQAEEVMLGVDERAVKARLVGRDETTDLALLAVDEELAPATFDEATPKVGQLALRLARPGETVRATSGIISTVGRKPWRTPRGADVDFFLEADAPHQPGFSGGPLLDLEGRVLGVTTTGLLPRQSVVIPTTTVRRVVAQLEQHGRIRRSYLGLQLQPVQLPERVRETTGEEVGLLVTSVEQGGPADQAGIAYGDTVLHLGDDSVRTLEDLYAFLRADRADQRVPVRLFRNGQVITQQVTLGAR